MPALPDDTTHRRELLALLALDDHDLDANRAGRLSVNQRRRRRSRARVGAAACAGLGLLLIAGGIYSDSNGGQWFVPVLLGVLSLAAGLLVFRSERGRRNVGVRRLTGRVEVKVVRVGRAGNALRLAVDGEPCHLPRRRGAGFKEWRALLTDEPYDVYVTDTYPMVVSIEPAP
jgi:hypothetical protein